MIWWDRRSIESPARERASRWRLVLFYFSKPISRNAVWVPAGSKEFWRGGAVSSGLACFPTRTRQCRAGLSHAASQLEVGRSYLRSSGKFSSHARSFSQDSAAKDG